MDPNAVHALGPTETTTGDDEGCVSEARLSGGRVPHGGSDDPLVIDFSANTNPRTPQGVARIYEAALSAARSYPSDDYYEYRGTAANYVGCEAEQVIPTAGGLGAVRLAIAVTVEDGDQVLVPSPGFGEYPREVCLQGGEPMFVDYDKVLETDPADYDLAIICSPNNPTGHAYNPGELSAYADRCRAAGTPLLIDEGFIGFTDLPSMAGRDGVIVVRSLTKLFGLPGLRAGFAVATGEYRDRLDTARRAWSLGAPAAAVGSYCMRQGEFVTETRERVAAERERLRETLSEEFDVYPSEAPFLLLDAGSSERVDDLLERCREHGIAVRDARTFRGLDQHIRVAIRLPEENDRLLDALVN
jgi:threonine-phosphate decarboxylase